jgi:hypothetical protein
MVIFNVIALEIRNKELMVQTVLKKIKDNFKSCIQIKVSANSKLKILSYLYHTLNKELLVNVNFKMRINY